MLLTASGIATAAPNVAGQTYGDAVAAIEQSGGVAVVAARIGSRLPLNECVVDGVTWPSYLRPGQGNIEPVRNEVRLTLNCNGTVATPHTPGTSAASPAGREAKEEQENAEWRSTADGQDWCRQAEGEHPEWFPLAGC